MISKRTVLGAGQMLIGLLLVIQASLPAQSQSDWRMFGQLTNGRHHFNAAHIGDGVILVVGGYVGGRSILDGSPVNTCEFIDLKSGTITNAPPSQSIHAVCPMLIDRTGSPIVIGGGTTSVERFDVATRTWKLLGNLRSARWQHAAAWIGNDEILVVGGYGVSSAEIFNVKTGLSRSSVSFIAPANSMQGFNIQIEVPFFVGYRTFGEGSARSSRVHTFNPSSGWSQPIPIPNGVARPEVLVTSSGDAIIVSGAVGETPFRTSTKVVRILAQRLDTSFVIGDLTEGRQHHGVAEWVDGECIVAGGFGNNARILASTEFVNSRTGIIKAGPRLTVPRTSFKLVSASFDDRTVVAAISGLSAGGTTPTVEVLETGCTPSSIIAPTLSVNGDARIANGEIHLTTTNQFSSGSVWRRYNGTVNSSGFHHQIVARFADGDNRGELDGTSPGADGITFVIQKQGPEALGLFGRGIGYNGIRDALAIEFDTFVNPQNSDPPTNHLAVMKPVDRFVESFHNSRSTLAQTESIPEVNADGKPFLLDYQYANGRLSVTLSTNGNVSTPSLVVDNLNVDSLLGLAPAEDYWIGFTSATGRAVQQHVIERWFDAPCGSVVLTSVNEGESPLPSRTELLVAPVPVQSFAAITLPNGYGAPVELAVYTVDGVLMGKQSLDPWVTSATLDARELSSGLYIVRYTGTGGSASFTMPVVR